MTVFLVERYLADAERQELDVLPARLAEATAQLRRSGIEITYLDSTFLPEDECCFCRFEAPSLHATELANRIAGAPFSRISAAVTLERR
jgi:Protein of unknown function (DUF4242)